MHPPTGMNSVHELIRALCVVQVLMAERIEATDADPLVQLGITFLLNTVDDQTGKWDVDEDNYTCYHATMVACQALLCHTFHGYGPGILACVDVLEAWRNKECPDQALDEHPDDALERKLKEPPPGPPPPGPPPVVVVDVDAPAAAAPPNGPNGPI